MLHLAENLKALRKSKGLTQEEASEILGVSPQSVSKWERGETFPDITLLPSLANLYKVSVDALIGMNKINDRQTRTAIFATAHKYWRNGDINSAIDVFSDALKTFPNDEGIMSDFAIALALCDDTDRLSQAVALCERVLSGRQGDKVHHTTRAALCFIYLKMGERDKAIAAAKKLPHLRESREMILSRVENDLSTDEINAYLNFIAIGENSEQDVIVVDFGIDMIAVCIEHDLPGKIEALRAEVGAPKTAEGFSKLPAIRVRDNAWFAPNRIRVRCYADYLLDKEFDNPADAINEVVEALRKIALRATSHQTAPPA